MFEHVRSRQWALGLMLDMMTLWTRVGGTYVNRHTLRTLCEQGFEIIAMDSVFLDIIVAAEARVAGGHAAAHGAGGHGGPGHNRFTKRQCVRDRYCLQSRRWTRP